MALLRSHSASTRSGLPFSTTYVASSAALSLHRADRFGWDEKDVSSVDDRRRLPIDLILQRAFEDIDDLFTGMLRIARW
jgi:hypothetical protein